MSNRAFNTGLQSIALAILSTIIAIYMMINNEGLLINILAILIIVTVWVFPIVAVKAVQEQEKDSNNEC